MKNQNNMKNSVDPNETALRAVSSGFTLFEKRRLLSVVCEADRVSYMRTVSNI